MIATPVNPESAATTTTVAASHRSGMGRWCVGVLAGLIVSLPLAWLLSLGVALPMLLGVFFFALFGLVIGAVMYRLASPARPIERTAIRLGTAAVVLWCWTTAYAMEVYDFPDDRAEYALKKVPKLPDGVTREEFLADVAQFVRDQLTARHGDADLWGYTRWVVAGGRMEYRVSTLKRPIVLPGIQSRYPFLARLLLSMGMLWFGVYGQVAPLAGRLDPPGASRPPGTIGV